MNARIKRMLDKLPVNICIGFAFGVVGGLAARWTGTFLLFFWIYVVISSICAYTGFIFLKHICAAFLTALIAVILTMWSWLFVTVFLGYVFIAFRLTYPEFKFKFNCSENSHLRYESACNSARQTAMRYTTDPAYSFLACNASYRSNR